MLIVGYCMGIRSERRLCEEIHLNLAYRWFCDLGLDGRVPGHSTFSRNRYGRRRSRGPRNQAPREACVAPDTETAAAPRSPSRQSHQPSPAGTARAHAKRSSNQLDRRSASACAIRKACPGKTHSAGTTPTRSSSRSHIPKTSGRSSIRPVSLNGIEGSSLRCILKNLSGIMPVQSVGDLSDPYPAPASPFATSL